MGARVSRQRGRKKFCTFRFQINNDVLLTIAGGISTLLVVCCNYNMDLSRRCFAVILYCLVYASYSEIT